ncbi:MAG TPA: hypothetical protein VGF40_18185, partial [Thermoanaerobaculia bacterium]
MNDVLEFDVREIQMTKRPLSVPALAVLLTVIAACGGAESAPEAAGEAVAETAVVETPEAPASPAGAMDITEADLDLYERAFAKEIEIVRAAG